MSVICTAEVIDSTKFRLPETPMCNCVLTYVEDTYLMRTWRPRRPVGRCPPWLLRCCRQKPFRGLSGPGCRPAQRSRGRAQSRTFATVAILRLGSSISPGRSLECGHGELRASTGIRAAGCASADGLPYRFRNEQHSPASLAANPDRRTKSVHLPDNTGEPQSLQQLASAGWLHL